MDALIHFVEALEFWGWITILVVSGVAIEAVVTVRRMQIKHAERMAKIQHGIDPGSETEAYKKDAV